MSRITLEDTAADSIVKMSDGNLGAAAVLVDIWKRGSEVDPQMFMGGMGIIMLLDTYEIYGTDIYVLWNDICKRDLIKTIAVIRSCQLGQLSQTILKDACSRQGYSGAELIDVESCLLNVQAALPDFGKSV